MGKHSLSSSSGHQLDKQGFGTYQIFNHLYLYKKPFDSDLFEANQTLMEAGVIDLSRKVASLRLLPRYRKICPLPGQLCAIVPGTKQWVGKNNSSELPSVIWNMVCCQSRFACEKTTLSILLFTLHQIAETPINTGLPAVKSDWALFTTLHHSSPYKNGAAYLCKEVC